MIKILVVDDESKIRELIKINLELAGYECFEAENGEKALEKLEKIRPNLVLLDIMLPGKDGYEVFEMLREKEIPIIFLTAKDSTLDKVKGLRMGAEDYITKPFEALELLARIEVVLRRNNIVNDVFSYNGIEIDFPKRIIKKDGKILDLTLKEFQLLEVLVRNKNLALSREKLLEKAWGYDYLGDTRTVDIHIQRLRKKLTWEDIITTVYKYGYRLEIN